MTTKTHQTVCKENGGNSSTSPTDFSDVPF